MKKIRVWDLPTRLFHWVLAVLIVVSVVTEKLGGNAMEWHFLSGYAALALIAFRLLWGMVGPRYARFSSFIYGPSDILSYLKGGAGKTKRIYAGLGHNPLGSLSVFALLGVVLMQAASGLFANDDIASEGPLVKFISKDLSDKMTWFHKEVSANLIYVLVALHIAAIVFYLARRKNLVKPMITGEQYTDIDAPATNDSWSMRLLALALFGACAGGVYYLTRL